MANPTQQSRYRVKGMDCASCAAKIDTAVRRVPGVEDVPVSGTAGTMTIRHVNDEAIAPAIAKRVTGLGYKLTRSIDRRCCAEGGRDLRLRP